MEERFRYNLLVYKDDSTGTKVSQKGSKKHMNQFSELYSFLDDLLLHGNFDVINDIMKEVDVDKASNATLYLYTSATVPIQDLLPARKLFVKKCKNKNRKNKIWEKIA